MPLRIVLSRISDLQGVIFTTIVTKLPRAEGRTFERTGSQLHSHGIFTFIFPVCSSNDKLIICLLVENFGVDHPLASCTRLGSNQKYFH